MDLSALEGGDASTDANAMDATDATDAMDAMDAAAPCDPAKPFSSVAPIAELNDADDQYKATLTPDELDIWYGVTHPFDGGHVVEIMHASRTSRTAQFGAPVAVATTMDGIDPSVTDDGLGLYYAKYGTVGSWDLFETTRPTRQDAFGIGAQLPIALQSTSSETGPFVAFDQSLWFASDRSQATHLYRAPFVDGGLDAPSLVPSLNSNAQDTGVVLTHDGLWAYVNSTRTDLGSAGGLDIFVAHRATTADDFAGMTNVTELNTSGADRANWISRDNCRLYFQKTQTGTGDLYVATKLP